MPWCKFINAFLTGLGHVMFLTAVALSWEKTQIDIWVPGSGISHSTPNWGIKSPNFGLCPSYYGLNVGDILYQCWGDSPVSKKHLSGFTSTLRPVSGSKLNQVRLKVQLRKVTQLHCLSADCAYTIRMYAESPACTHQVTAFSTALSRPVW